MNIQILREFKTEAESEILRKRLGRWSDKYGFVCTRDQLNEWEFERGSQLMALVTFDIRKVPTAVTVTVSDGSPKNIQCAIRVASLWQLATPGDPKRVEEQIELLIAYLKGAFD